MAKRILITGGAGFIGINAARHFLAKGWQVTIFDNLSRAGTDINIRDLKKERIPGWTFVRADIVKDFARLSRETAKADAVLHLAAQVAVTTSIADPRNDFEQNALGTFNVLEAVRAAEPHPILLFASTNKVYGALDQFPVHAEGKRFRFRDPAIERHGVAEDVPLDFHSPYGCSKGAADQYVLDYSRIYGLKTVVFRQSCVYGEHQFGVEDQGWVAWFAIAAMKGRPITLYGSGRQVRDVLYVGDLVELYHRAITRIAKARGKAYNVGGGPSNTVSLLECLDHLGMLLGSAIRTGKAPLRAGDQPIFVADIRNAKRDLGWAPKVGFEEGCARLFGWLQLNRESVLSIK